MTGLVVVLLVAVCGGLGAAARFLVDGAVGRRARSAVPLGTVVVNVSACLLLGLVTGWVVTHAGPDALASVVGVGFLGGYSTFSTASVEGARLLLAGRPAAAVVHALGMLGACLGATAVGLVVGGLL
ncbi:CrcB family protein [Cellulosimicrobium sp. PMB13]|uniref:fluoride efflux transporter FluC n=1 Tax=Cellulosimicrobium sp. PMB13 TaxID=3120158 RepID=UPI003F4B7C53